jgi:hypothetical protein
MALLAVSLHVFLALQLYPVGQTNLAEAGTLSMEFSQVSHLIGKLHSGCENHDPSHTKEAT